MPTLPRAAKWLFLTLISGFCLASATIAINGLSDQVAQADLVVVPGNTVYPDGRLSDRLKGRLDAAVEIYRAGNCQAILVSGAVGVEGVDESRAMHGYLLQQGVPESKLIQDPQGFNTEATARNTALLMRARGFHSAIAVSQYFHVPRLRLLLQRQGVNVVGKAHARYFEMRDTYSLAREVIAMAHLLIPTSH